MATILVYNNISRSMETFYKGESEAMPYIAGSTLTVKEFRGSSKSTVLWTDRRVMDTWNAFRRYYGRPIGVGYAFKRIWEGGHGAQSQHYAGTSFDTGQNLDAAGRNDLHAAAVRFGGWSYVEPQELTPSWVHFDKRLFPPACPTGGYPMVSNGSRGVYVLVAQDALNAAGYNGYTGVDGIFGSGTARGVIAFQRDNGLAADGVVGCNTWRVLTSRVAGIGYNQNVIRP